MPALKAQWQFVKVHGFELPEYPRGLAFSPDGKHLAMGAADGSVAIVEVNSGAVTGKTKLPDEVASVAWSPIDARLAVACHDGAAHLLSVEATAVASLSGSTRGWVERVAWSVDGTLAMSSGKQVRLWQRDLTPLLETQNHESTVTGLCWGRTGQTLYTSCYGGVRRWSLNERAESKRFEWKGSLISLAVSPDEAIVAAGSQDCSVHFWRVATGKDSEMTGYPSKPDQLAWSADSKLLATSGANVICVWNFAGRGPEGKPPMQLEGHDALVTGLAFLSDGFLASGSEDGALMLWSPAQSTHPLSTMSDSEHGAVCELAASGVGDVATASSSGLVTVWRAERKTLR